MEILIIGVILVALMAYASTRIKRSAAAAFESETVETPDFVIQKPAGFLNVIADTGRGYAFEAYSKEFGEPPATEFKMGRAFLTVSTKSPEVPADRRNARAEVIDDVHYQIYETDRLEKETEFVDQFKVAEHGGPYFEFRTTRLANAPDDFVKKLEAMLDGFRLK